MHNSHTQKKHLQAVRSWRPWIEKQRGGVDFNPHAKSVVQNPPPESQHGENTNLSTILLYTALEGTMSKSIMTSQRSTFAVYQIRPQAPRGQAQRARSTESQHGKNTNSSAAVHNLRRNDEQVDKDGPTIDLRHVPNTPSGSKRTSSRSLEQTE